MENHNGTALEQERDALLEELAAIEARVIHAPLDPRGVQRLLARVFELNSEIETPRRN